MLRLDQVPPRVVMLALVSIAIYFGTVLFSL